MSSKRRWAGAAALALGLALCGGPVWAADVRGSVLVEGPPPARETFIIKAKSKKYPIEGCGAVEKDSAKLQVGAGGGVKDAVVWIEGTAPDAPQPVMDQHQCVFSPHVLAVSAGGSVAIRNSDRVVHNVRIFREGKTDMLMHQWQKIDAADIPWKFEEPGRYLVRCGVHPWMYGWVFVTPPGVSAVTDEEGRFTLAGIAPGKHTLKVWHETLGSREIPVEVGPDGKQVEPVLFPAPPKEGKEISP